VANYPSDPPQRSGQPKEAPVRLYALIFGTLVVCAAVFGVIFGQRSENPHPSPVSSAVPTTAPNAAKP
jgi:hypothetical protein